MKFKVQWYYILISVTNKYINIRFIQKYKSLSLNFGRLILNTVTLNNQYKMWFACSLSSLPGFTIAH